MRYILAAQKLKPAEASNLSMVITFLGCFGTVQYVNNLWNVIPIALGCWVGTYITLWYEKRKIIKL